MEDTISRKEHEEFAKRMEEENNRQNHRLGKLEDTVEQIHALTASVQKLAISVESMVKEQEQQGKRLETIENRDGEMWRKLIGYVLTALASAVMTFIFTRIGH